MSDLALQYYNSIDKLDLHDLEILSQKITSLIFKKKAKEDDSVKKGLAYFNIIKGTVTREIQSREPFSENASKIINSYVKKENEGYISAHSLSDIFFHFKKRQNC